MTKVYLMRHGETEWNIEKRFQGSDDSPLTDCGKQQAVLVAERLKEMQLAAVYASPRKRAIETATVVANAQNLKVEIHSDLAEIALGEWEGKTYSEIKQYDPKGYQSFFHNPGSFEGIHGGETFVQVRQRAINTLEKLAEKHQEQRILVVSHAITIRLLLTHYLKSGINDLWHVAQIGQTSITEIRFLESEREVGLIGCTSHLSEDSC